MTRLWILLLAILLVGCAATPSYDELFQQASDCTRAKAIGCDVLWDEVNRRDEWREKRMKQQDSRCNEPGVKCISVEEWVRMQERGW